MRRVSGRLLPFLFLLYVVCFIDRTNVSFAALQMNRDLGLSAAVYGLGAGVFFVGYALFEVPSNLILARVGARRWIGRIAITWGFLAMGMMFVQGPRSFYAMRFLLGVAEAGYFPGIIYYLSLWFPERHLARATSQLMIGIPLASAIGGPLSGVLLGLDGTLGLAGWQWLFLVEGFPAVLLGLVALRYLTDGVDQAYWLSEESRGWLSAQLERERASLATRTHVRFTEVLQSRRVALLTLTYFCFAVTLYGLTLWLPLMVRDKLGLSNAQVGLVIGLTGLGGATAMLLNSAHSDRSGERIRHTAVPALLAGIVVGTAGFLGESLGAIVALAVAIMLLNAMGPTFWTLPRLVMQGTAAAGGIALINAVGNLGGFAGPYGLGAVKERTDSYAAGLLLLATGCFLAAVLLLVLGREATTPPHAREGAHP
jgi:ACS family tartrate transporter-like MFS transporter